MIPLGQRIEILYTDEHFLAVNKPAGVLTIPGRSGAAARQPTVLSLLAKQGPLRLVHRLDGGTSGVLLLARSLEAQRALSAQFRERTVQKEYLALVRGRPTDEDGLIDAPLSRHPNDPRRVRIDRRGKPSQTRWRIERCWPAICLLRCWPLTGRQHQIRAHLSHIDHPLLVDPLYRGGKKFLLSEIKPHYRLGRDQVERPLMDRVSLHAERISLAHPVSGEQVSVQAPWPKDFRAVVGQLDKWAGRQYGRQANARNRGQDIGGM